MAECDTTKMDGLILKEFARRLAIFFCVVTLGITSYVFFTWRRLSHIPGPFWPSLSKYWMVKQSLKGQMHSACKELTEKYGKRFLGIFSNKRLTFDRLARTNRPQ